MKASMWWKMLFDKGFSNPLFLLFFLFMDYSSSTGFSDDGLEFSPLRIGLPLIIGLFIGCVGGYYQTVRNNAISNAVGLIFSILDDEKRYKISGVQKTFRKIVRYVLFIGIVVFALNLNFGDDMLLVVYVTFWFAYLICGLYIGLEVVRKLSGKNLAATDDELRQGEIMGPPSMWRKRLFVIGFINPLWLLVVLLFDYYITEFADGVVGISLRIGLPLIIGIFIGCVGGYCQNARNDAISKAATLMFAIYEYDLYKISGVQKTIAKIIRTVSFIIVMAYIVGSLPSLGWFSDHLFWLHAILGFAYLLCGLYIGQGVGWKLVKKNLTTPNNELRKNK